MITVVLCIVIVCIRRYHRERDYKVAYNKTKLNTDVTKANTTDHLCSTNKAGGSYVPINPPYTKLCNKRSEDDYNYIQLNEFVQHSDLEDTIEMDTNLSCQVNTTNPAYGVSKGNTTTNTDPAYASSTGDSNIMNTDPAYTSSTGDSNIMNTDPAYASSTGDSNIMNADPVYASSTGDTNMMSPDTACGVSEDTATALTNSTTSQ